MIKQPVSIGALILIALGVALLLHNFGMLSFAFMRQWWPAILIVLGVVMLVRPRR